MVETSRTSESLEKGQERQLSLQVSTLLGCDVRPSRIFLWLGAERGEYQWIASLDRRPRVLRFGRPRRHFHVAGVRASYLGNPVVTIGLAAAGWFRHLRRVKRRV